MTFKFNNVYISDIASVAGPVEKKGPLGKYFDKTYDDFYMECNTFEKGEIKMINDSIDILLNKINICNKDIDLVIGGNLANQLVPLNYALEKEKISYIGVYSACATLASSIIVASSMIENGSNKVICNVSSNNSSCEKQFRNPCEYGTPKPDTATITATGAVSMLLTNKKSSIKVESCTIGRVIDYGIKDVNNVGAAMAPSASDTIFKHLKDLDRSIDYYDLVLTGDLGLYGMSILKELIKEEHDIILDKYNDCGVMLYDLKKQDVKAGASGPTSSALVLTYIIDLMKKGKLKKVLLVCTGALFSPTSIFQKESIPSISHAISLEVL